MNIDLKKQFPNFIHPRKRWIPLQSEKAYAEGVIFCKILTAYRALQREYWDVNNQYVLYVNIFYCREINSLPNQLNHFGEETFYPFGIKLRWSYGQKHYYFQKKRSRKGLTFRQNHVSYLDS